MTDNTKTGGFKTNYKIAWLSGLGILGFITGCFILFNCDIFKNGSASVFHEVVYQPRDIASGVIKRRTDELRVISQQRAGVIKLKADSITKHAQSDENLKVRLVTERDSLIQLNKIDSIDIVTLKKYQDYYSNVSESDTSSFSKLNRALHFQITPKMLDSWDSLFRNGNIDFKTGFSFKDASLTQNIDGEYTFRINDNFPSDIAFVTKYPAAGVWMLLILIFCSFLFMAISTSVYLHNKLLELFTDNNVTGLDKKDYFLVVLFTLLCFAALIIIWVISFYDDDIIKNLFFMRSFTTSLAMVTVLGYLGGAFCLAGFIHTAAMLGYFAKEINRVAAESNTAAPASTVLTTEQKIYMGLRSAFQTYFILSAVILSLLVLTTGALFSTVNSLDFVKLLSDDWGYSPARTDFVYLYGGLHTVILLLVYIPAKMRFSEITIKGVPDAPLQGKWIETIKSPFGPLKEVLIAASPLLASVVQSMVDIFFN